MANLTVSEKERDFFVYVNPKDWLIRHNLGLIGSFFSTPADDSNEVLMFLPNPRFKAFISPFQNHLLRNYSAEYNLEISRQKKFKDYPCRLQAIFLLENPDHARAYAALHPEHVKDRLLKKCKTTGKYSYSMHDSSWIDFLRLGHSMDDETLSDVGDGYWSGKLVAGNSLISMGKPWSQEPVMEVLFLGRIDFYDKSLI